MALMTTTLQKTDATTDKVYTLAVEQDSMNTFTVAYANGPRGGTLHHGTRSVGLTRDAAYKLYSKIIAGKIADGYWPVGDAQEGANATEVVQGDGRASGILPQLLNPITEREASAIVAHSSGWMMQPKKDGECKLLRSEGGKVALINRKGQFIACPGELSSAVARISGDFILHGEHVGPIFWVFDCLSFNGGDVRALPYSTRIDMATAIVSAIGAPFKMIPTAEGSSAMRAMWQGETLNQGEGLVFKRAMSVYKPGRPSSGGDQLKFKFWQSATCEVLCHNDQASVEVACRENGQLVRVGSATASASVLAQLSVGSLVEVKYLYLGAGNALVQSNIIAIRRDKDEPDQFSSLKRKGADQ